VSGSAGLYASLHLIPDNHANIPPLRSSSQWLSNALQASLCMSIGLLGFSGLCVALVSELAVELMLPAWDCTSYDCLGF